MFFQTFEDRGQWRSVRDGSPWDRKPVRWAPQWLTTTQFTSWKEFPDCAKLNSQWLTVVNISHDTIKLLEKITGKTFSDINHTNVFLGWSLKAKKAKINKWDLIKLTSSGTAKETINKWKTVYRLGEKSCKWCECDWQGLNFQNIKTAHTVW